MNNFNFKKISRAKIAPGKTVPYACHRIDGVPVLTVKPIGEANPGYMKSMLSGARESLRRMKGGGITPEMLTENRVKDLELFPRLVVTGWTGVMNDDGEEVPFSPEACKAFFEAWPFDYFNELRDFCATLDNFRDVGAISNEDAEAIAGN